MKRTPSTAEEYNKLKNLPEGFDSRLDQSKDTIRMFKDGSSEVIQSEKQKEKDEEKWQKPKALWYTIKKSNYYTSRSHIIRVQKEKKEKSLGNFSEEIVAHKFSTWGRRWTFKARNSNNNDKPKGNIETH